MMMEVFFNKGGNSENRKSIKFLNKDYVHPERIKPGAQGTRVEWEYIGNPTDIVFTKPGCGCTVSPEYVGNKIFAYFNELDITADGIGLSNDDKVRKYKEISRTLTVYFDDGEPLKNPNGTINSKKANIVISFTIQIDLSAFKPFDPGAKKKF